MHFCGCHLQLHRTEGHGLGLVFHRTRQQTSKPLPTRARLQSQSKQPRLPPYTFVTNPNAVDVNELSALLAATNQNCEMFPLLSAEGTLESPPDAVKLRRALRHSTVVMAMYVGVGQSCGNHMQRDWLAEAREHASSSWIRPWIGPSGSSNKCLVGFGRATSDRALTASIYDLAVAPSMQRMGIGKRIVSRIVRDLRRLGISDIAISTTDDLRPFFQSCGFGNDVLGSTGMTYTRRINSTTSMDQSRDSGRLKLYIPSPFATRNS